MHWRGPRCVVLGGGKSIVVLAVLGIAGVTGAVGVLVAAHDNPTQRAAHAPPHRASEPAKPRPRPHLTTTTDVRTLALHRAHLEAADRVECASCHDMQARDFHAPPVEKCLGCHKGHEPAVHGSSPEAGCLTCHDFLLPEGAAKWAHQCETCHENAEGKHQAIAIHARQECTECHAVHPRRDTKPAECLGCHDTRATGHPAGGSGRAVCLQCHVPHRPAKDAVTRCETCHVEGSAAVPAAVRIPPTALFRGGHERCVGCHAGHTFTRATVKACRDCHADKHVLAQDKVPAHAACTSCHDPHAAKSPPAARCATCHGAIAAGEKHPHDARGRDCIGCHPPHQDLDARIVLGCTEQCHGEKRDAAHGTATCRDCHQRHRFLPEKTGPALCLGCHAKPIGHAPAIATSEGHASCTNCHRTAPHRAAGERPACGTCHAAEASTVPTGHADCKKCHDVHTGTRKLDCAGCHADRTHTPHVKLGCQTCHRPHGPKGPAEKPACATCHATLTGLHESKGHKTCNTCHLAHAPDITGREPCLRCHTDRRDHFPTARVCQACHPFTGAKP